MKTTTTTTTTKREETKNRLNDLVTRRNALVNALEISTDIFKPQFDEIVTELCETVAQIATYKTLLKLSDGAKDITQSGADMCQKMLYSFPVDMHIYRTGDLTAIYSDAMDIYHTAYFEVWQILKNSVPLSLDDTVFTRQLKNGDVKNYTVFQVACKSIREYIHAWSKGDQYKKLHYVIGFTDKGEQVTTSKRPQDDLTDIDEKTKNRFFNKYGLTAKEQEIIKLKMQNKDAEEIAYLLNIPCVTVWKNIARAKAKFATATAYEELCTARNAEKRAKAEFEKASQEYEEGDLPDTEEIEKAEIEKLEFFSNRYKTAQDRTAKALEKWKKEFYKEMKKDR